MLSLSPAPIPIAAGIYRSVQAGSRVLTLSSLARPGSLAFPWTALGISRARETKVLVTSAQEVRSPRELVNCANDAAKLVASRRPPVSVSRGLSQAALDRESDRIIQIDRQFGRLPEAARPRG